MGSWGERLWRSGAATGEKKSDAHAPTSDLKRKHFNAECLEPRRDKPALRDAAGLFENQDEHVCLNALGGF
jgi:hypothetical protein